MGQGFEPEAAFPGGPADAIVCFPFTLSISFTLGDRLAYVVSSNNWTGKSVQRPVPKPEMEANMTGLEAFTLFHVVLSLIGIGSGFAVLAGFLNAKNSDGWNMLFLVTTFLTSATGFLFPFHEFLPSHGVGILSIIVLAVAIVARNARRLAGGWRKTYVITAMIALYFNMFVLVVQLFQKVPPLKALAPTQSEPPFAIAQLALLLVFAALTFLAVKKFQPAAMRANAMGAGR